MSSLTLKNIMAISIGVFTCSDGRIIISDTKHYLIKKRIKKEIGKPQSYLLEFEHGKYRGYVSSLYPTDKSESFVIDDHDHAYRLSVSEGKAKIEPLDKEGRP